MSDRDSNVGRALELLTLADVWELAPDHSEAPRRPGVRKSPLREDRHGASFSIHDGLRRAKDHATGESYGVWQWVQVCRPDWSKREIARYLVERAGLPWEEQGRAQASRVAKSPAQWRKEREEAEERAERKRRQSLYVAPLTGLKPWPVIVERRWTDGLSATADPQGRAEALAERRGWPVEWAESLVLAERLSFPRLPWNEHRWVALRVEDPQGQPLGYHQQFVCKSTGERSWLFVPWRPNERMRDVMWVSQMSFSLAQDFERLAPLPFVLGELETAQVWVLTEGQWDAITLWGALGGFEERELGVPVAVLGLRGVNGAAAMLGAYGGLLRRRRPRLWLLPDNDEPSWRWDGKGAPRKAGEPAPVTLIDRLRALVGSEVEIPVTRVDSAIGKDFNDLWKAKRPAQAAIVSEMENLGLISA